MHKFVWFVFGIILFACTSEPLKQVRKKESRLKGIVHTNDNTLRRDTLPLPKEEQSAYRFEELVLPGVDKNDQIIRHIGYTLSYVERAEQAEWVAYVLTAAEVAGNIKRSDHFKEDPFVGSNSASASDYKGTGWDRGHLAPAADMKWSKQAMEESFYFSNMSPQSPSFNRGIWKRLEEQVRDWAMQYDSICVITGPILTGNLNSIGYNQVAVPAYYYKVILAATNHGYTSIGFLLPNAGSGEDLSSFAVSVDKVEQVSGIDFFHRIANSEEKCLEASIHWKDWHISDNRVRRGQNDSSISKHQRSESVQCSGTTKKGRRCRNKTLSEDGRCYLHSK